MSHEAGDLVRIKSSKKEALILSVDGDDLLVAIDEGAKDKARRWVKAGDVSASIGGDNLSAKETNHWLNR